LDCVVVFIIFKDHKFIGRFLAAFLLSFQFDWIISDAKQMGHN
jgi:hypothetical protein